MKHYSKSDCYCTQQNILLAELRLLITFGLYFIPQLCRIRSHSPALPQPYLSSPALQCRLWPKCCCMINVWPLLSIAPCFSPVPGSVVWCAVQVQHLVTVLHSSTSIRGRGGGGRTVDTGTGGSYLSGCPFFM